MQYLFDLEQHQLPVESVVAARSQQYGIFTTLRRPPESNPDLRVTSVLASAVLAISATDGNARSAHLLAAESQRLLNSRQPQLLAVVVDPFYSAFDKLLGRTRLASTGLIDEDVAIQLGPWLYGETRQIGENSSTFYYSAALPWTPNTP